MNNLLYCTLRLRRATLIPRTVVLIALSALVGCADDKEATSQDLNGKYRIVKAYELLHDQGPLREIETREVGVIIMISGDVVTAGVERHKVAKREKLTGDEFDTYHAGMNYQGVGKEVFGKIPEDAKITLLRLDSFSATDLIGSSIFGVNGRLLVDAAREFTGRKDWASDMYFYWVERM